MSDAKWPEGYQKLVFDEIDSTSAEAVRRLPDLTGPTWFFAGAQTEGRGRRGRGWASPHGNFSATLIMRPEGGVAQAGLRSFVAAVALDTALSEVTHQPHRFSLKWPNDVLLDGGKLAGILLESAGQSGALDFLTIGIGVNLAFTPGGDHLDSTALQPVALSEATGISVDPLTFFTHLAAAYARYEEQFTRFGFAPIRRVWLSRAARLGEQIVARTTRESIEGVFETVDEDGNLILAMPEGQRKIAAADVFFRDERSRDAAGN